MSTRKKELPRLGKGSLSMAHSRKIMGPGAQIQLAKPIQKKNAKQGFELEDKRGMHVECYMVKKGKFSNESKCRRVIPHGNVAE